MKFLLVLQITVFLLDLILCSPIDFLTPQTRGRKSREIRCVDRLSEQTDVYITLSSLVSVDKTVSIVSREIELNWNTSMALPQDQVGLFESDPSVNMSHPLVLISAQQHEGKFRSSFKFGYPYIPASIQKDHCLSYWIAYIRNGTVINKDCFKLRPTWMKDNADHLQDIPLRSLFIPGTHNSGSYDIYRGSPSETVIKRYTVNQDDTVWDQLMYGNRYLDIRVGYYPQDTKNPFWVNHDQFQMNPISVVIQDIKRFLNTTNEILILDFHRFPVGFDHSDIHVKFITYLMEQLGEYAAPNYLGKDVTMGEMWRNGFQLIISYNVDNASEQISRLWDPVKQFWGDAQKISSLERYLKYLMIDRYRRDYYWAAMAELTPRLIDVFLRPTKGLRVMADKVNTDITHWFRDLWWKDADIVATDFYHGNNIIDVAIKANIIRSKCNTSS